eukprot:3556155-Lingulodinium_polyedra.AAC.1
MGLVWGPPAVGRAGLGPMGLPGRAGIAYLGFAGPRGPRGLPCALCAGLAGRCLFVVAPMVACMSPGQGPRAQLGVQGGARPRWSHPGHGWRWPR